MSCFFIYTHFQTDMFEKVLRLHLAKILAGGRIRVTSFHKEDCMDVHMYTFKVIHILMCPCSAEEAK